VPLQNGWIDFTFWDPTYTILYGSKFAISLVSLKNSLVLNTWFYSLRGYLGTLMHRSQYITEGGLRGDYKKHWILLIRSDFLLAEEADSLLPGKQKSDILISMLSDIFAASVLKWSNTDMWQSILASDIVDVLTNQFAESHCSRNIDCPSQISRTNHFFESSTSIYGDSGPFRLVNYD